MMILKTFFTQDSLMNVAHFKKEYTLRFYNNDEKFLINLENNDVEWQRFILCDDFYPPLYQIIINFNAGKKIIKTYKSNDFVCITHFYIFEDFSVEIHNEDRVIYGKIIDFKPALRKCYFL